MEKTPEQMLAESINDRVQKQLGALVVQTIADEEKIKAQQSEIAALRAQLAALTPTGSQAH